MDIENTPTSHARYEIARNWTAMRRAWRTGDRHAVHVHRSEVRYWITWCRRVLATLQLILRPKSIN